MIDALGYTPLDDGFHHVNRDSWIAVGKYINGQFVQTVATGGGYMYQKHCDDTLLPIVLTLDTQIYAPDYRKWREEREGKPYSEIVAHWAKMREDA